MISRTLEDVPAQVDNNTFGDGAEVSYLTPIVPPAVGHVSALQYTVVATIQDPDGRTRFLRIVAAANHRGFEGINFRVAPVGSRCLVDLDLIANTGKIHALQEVALFDPCDTVVQAPTGTIIDITPNPGRPPTPDDPIPGGWAG